MEQSTSPHTENSQQRVTASNLIINGEVVNEIVLKNITIKEDDEEQQAA